MVLFRLRKPFDGFLGVALKREAACTRASGDSVVEHLDECVKIILDFSHYFLALPGRRARLRG